MSELRNMGENEKRNEDTVLDSDAYRRPDNQVTTNGPVLKIDKEQLKPDTEGALPQLELSDRSGLGPFVTRDREGRITSIQYPGSRSYVIPPIPKDNVNDKDKVTRGDAAELTEIGAVRIRYENGKPVIDRVKLSNGQSYEICEITRRGTDGKPAVVGSFVGLMDGGNLSRRASEPGGMIKPVKDGVQIIDANGEVQHHISIPGFRTTPQWQRIVRDFAKP